MGIQSSLRRLLRTSSQVRRRCYRPYGRRFSGSADMRPMPLCDDGMHFHRDAKSDWTQLWARLVHDAKPIALSHRRSPVATSSIDATDMSASHRSISPLLEEAPAPWSQEDKIFDAGDMPCEEHEILGNDRGAQLLKTPHFSRIAQREFLCHARTSDSLYRRIQALGNVLEGRR